MTKGDRDLLTKLLESQTKTTANMANLSDDVKTIAEAMPKVIIMEQQLIHLGAVVEANRVEVDKKFTRLEKAFMYVFALLATTVFGFIFDKITSV